jgi:gluconokinase
MTLATTPAEIARAMIESVTYRFGLVVSLLVQEIGQVKGIIGSGVGLLHSPVWMEIMTDVLGRPISASATEEATCRGAALLALEALGEIDDLARIPAPLGRIQEPNAEHTKIYSTATRRQEHLYSLFLSDQPHVDTGQAQSEHTETVRRDT